jgi:hypothetical protein
MGSQIKLFMSSSLIINLSHYSCLFYGSSLVQDQLKLSTLISHPGSRLTMQCRSSRSSKVRIHKYLKKYMGEGVN